MFTLLKTLRWLYKTLNSDVRPWQVALGFTLGALAGLLPLGLGTFAVFTVILLVNVHFGSLMFSFGLFRMLGWALGASVLEPLGEVFVQLLPHGPLIFAAKSPILSWLRLDHFDVAGAIALWLILATPLLVGIHLAWSRWQDSLLKKLKESRLLKWASKIWIFKALRYVLIGTG